MPLRRLALALAGCAATTTVLLSACARPARPPEIVAPAETVTSPTAALPPGAWPEIALQEMWAGFDQPLLVTNAGDASGRLFVVEKTGRVRVIRDGHVLRDAYLDLSEAVSADGERGLLGLAFAPDFAENGRFYVDYTDREGTTVVARYTVSDPGADSSAGARAETLLTVDQPFPNHNGGCIVFGPDRMLYIGTGDGGAGGDPFGNAQDGDSLLGKMLRLDVGEATTGSPPEGSGYAVPADNPFVDFHPASAAPRPEIWATGLQNPWRFSFDRATGDLWIGDVGQGDREEIDLQPADSGGGEDYGWNLYEGSHAFPPGSSRSAEGLTMPVVDYDHTAGSSVTGGYVYRGHAHPTLVGTYLYADFVTGRVWGLRPAGEGWENAELLDTALNIASFGEDEEGELYVVDLNGAVLRVATR